jgi:hypothetical protein
MPTAEATPSTIATRYGDLSPTPGTPLKLGKPNPEWWASGAAEGYTQALLEAFATHHPEAAKDLAFIANEAKWSVGWKGFGRMILEVL